MSLSPVEREKVELWLEQNCPALSCQACGEKNFAVGSLAVAPLVSAEALTGPPDLSKAEVSPLVTVYCMNCKLTLFFLAVPLGIVSHYG
jgi:hypothetical protein